MRLGAIGDDFTGSSDLANTLAQGGMRTVQYTGVPDTAADPSVDAGVVALKIRSIAAQDAVSQALEALAWLDHQGCEQIFFKYCSTFDSTPEGNIGPVADALADALNADRVVFCPAFPATGRTLYQGHLFVDGVPLQESGMRDHPLTPMTDSDLRRWLALQTASKVGHVPASVVFDGDQAIVAALDAERSAGHRHVVVDAIRDLDLLAIGRAVQGRPLVTGGSGMALGLPANFGCTAHPPDWSPQPGRTIAVSGSCSETTRRQVAAHGASHPALAVEAGDVIDGRLTPDAAAAWLLENDGIPLLYSSTDPATVAAVHDTYGRDRSSQALERFFAESTRLAVEGGATRVITAGGETSGAVIGALDITTLEIGPEIDPGIPALRATPDLVVALKSGNFGTDDFFAKAHRVLEGIR